MYEHMTFEFLLERMLSRVSNNVDKRKDSSLIYNSAAMLAWELEAGYRALDNIVELGFAETAAAADNDEWLDKHVGEQGIKREQATSAVRAAHFNIPVNKDEQFFYEGLYFTVLETGADTTVQCNTPGTIGNQPPSGSAILPLNNIPLLTSAILGDVLIPGEDRESNTSLYARYLEKLNQDVKDGNRQQYISWAKEVDGVGQVRVFPLWDGPNTVKVVITDAEGVAASPELVQRVQDYLDPGSTGLGDGAAPIGAIVTVVSAIAKEVTVAATVTLTSGQALEPVFENVTNGIKSYFKEAAFSPEHGDIIRYVQIGNVFFNAPGVIDYQNLTVNGSVANIVLSPEEIPVLKEVILNV